MTNFSVFLKKELKEFVKTWTVLILFLLLLSNAIFAPVLAYYTPKLLEMSGLDMGEMIGEMYNQTIESAYQQYYSMQMQMGFLAIVFITCLSVVKEKKDGSAVLTLTKNLSRTSFILGKFVSYAIWYTICYLVSSTTFVLLGKLIFKSGLNKNAFFSLLIFYLLGLLFVATSIFASAISKNILISCLVGFGFYAAIFILASIPYISDYTPGVLANRGYSILYGDYSEILIPILVTLALIVLANILAVLSFQKQEL